MPEDNICFTRIVLHGENCKVSVEFLIGHPKTFCTVWVYPKTQITKEIYRLEPPVVHHLSADEISKLLSERGL